VSRLLARTGNFFVLIAFLTSSGVHRSFRFQIANGSKPFRGDASVAGAENSALGNGVFK